MYRNIAKFYDNYTEDVDYEALADLLERFFAEFGNEGLKNIAAGGKSSGAESNGSDISKSTLVMDVGCGTGVLTKIMSRRGYDMTGLDASLEMLEAARCDETGNNILWLCQDMTEMDTYGSYAAMYCLEDGVNHLLSRKSLEAFVRRAYNFIDRGGIIIFDFLRRSYFEAAAETGVFLDDNDDGTCVWTADYNSRSHIIKYDLICYKELENGLFERLDDTVREHAWEPAELGKILESNGFELLCLKNRAFEQAGEGDGRQYVAARRK